MAITTITKQLGMLPRLSSHVRLWDVLFSLISGPVARTCIHDQTRIVAVVKIAVLSQVSGHIGREIKDIKNAHLFRIIDTKIGIIILMTGAHLHINTDLTVTARTIMHQKMIRIITQANAMKIK